MAPWIQYALSGWYHSSIAILAVFLTVCMQEIAASHIFIRQLFSGYLRSSRYFINASCEMASSSIFLTLCKT